MKEFILSPHLIYTLLIAGMIADFKYSVEWAGNLSLFALWVIILFAFLSLLADSKELFKKKSDRVKMLMCLVCLLTQVAIGWIFTAVFFFLSWFFILIKKAIHEEELRNAGI